MAVWSEVRLDDFPDDLRIDAEYFQPEYIRQDRAMERVKVQPLSDFADVSDGNHVTIADEFSEEGIPYLRGGDLGDFFLSTADPVCISEKTYKQLKRSHMLEGDVLVGVVGTIGSVALVTDQHDKLTGNCKIAILRPKSIASEYLAAYLLSSIGQNEIKRRVRGAVQMGLILPDLGELPVIIPTNRILTKIVDFVKAAEEKRHTAKTTIASAESRLVSALGLEGLDLSPTQCYARNFKEMQAEERFDAEYFNPKYQRLIKKLREGGQTLADVCDLSQRKFIPQETPGEHELRYIEIGSLTGDGEAEPEVMPQDDAPSRATWIVKPGDIITSLVRPIRRLSAIIHDEQDGCVCSSGFAVLSPKSGREAIEPEVLLTYLRLPLICELLDLNTTASMYPAIPTPRLMRIPIKLPDKATRKYIINKVRDSMTARREAADLLEQAKQTVEDLIAGKGKTKRKKKGK